MANTLIIYEGTGSTTDYTVPFDYLLKKFVRVTIGTTVLQGGNYGDTSADYYFLDKNTIRLKTAPESGIFITVRRYTSATERVVSFKDASILKATDLDTSAVQNLHIAEEARDIINDALILDKSGNWDAKNKRITNVGDPVAPKDAVTKEYVDTTTEKLKTFEEYTKLNKGYRDETEGFRDESLANATSAKASAGTAVEAMKVAVESKNTSESVLKTVTELESQARASASDAQNSASTATIKAQEARVSANNSKDSELKTLSYKQDAEKAVVLVAPIIPIAPEIKIVADNIDHVVTDSNNIDKINIVGTDLSGSLSDTLFEDYGDLGNTGVPLPAITGGNIKTVSDNIGAVRTVAGLAPDFQTAIGAVNTVTQLTLRAEKASKSAEASATKASGSETNAKTSEVSASGSAGLAKNWANKMDGTVDGTEYSAKYYANKAKTSETNAADSASAAAASQAQASKDANTARGHSSGSQVWAQLSEKHKKAAETAEANAKTSETNAASSASEATAQAERAKGYADQASTGQVQADWAETDTTAKGFIKNKPDLSDYATTTALTTGLSGKANTSHTHYISDVTGLQATLDSKANSPHTHSISNVIGLQNALDGKLSVATFEGYVDYGDLGTP
nr:MAG TPA: tail fiber protein [Caudoviricetes sp.]